MDGFLREDTAIDIRVGPFLDSGDGYAAETGLTITQAEVRLSKVGGDFAQKNEATSLVHDELGMYICKLDATDTNTPGLLKIVIYEAGALVVWHDFMVISQIIFDSLFGAAAADYIPVDVVQWNGTAVHAPALAGVPYVDVHNWVGAAAPAMTGDAYARIGAPVGASISVDIAAVKTDTAAILVDTATIDTAGEIAAAVWSADATTYQTQGTFGQAIGDPVSDTGTIYKAVVTDATGVTVGADTTALLTDVAAAHVHIDKIPQSDGTLTWNSTALGSIQSEANDALVAYDPPTNAELTAAKADVTVTGIGANVITAASINTGAITNAKFAAGAIDASAIAADAIGASELAADAVTEIANAMATHTGTCQAGSAAGTIVLASGASGVDDFYIGCLVAIVNSTGVGQARQIIDYVGATRTGYVSDPWIVTPTNTSEYRVYPFSGILLADSGIAAAVGAASITLAASAPAVANTYVGHTVFISGGTGIGQARIITAYTAGRVCTVRAWDTALDATSVYQILPVGRVYVNEIAAGAITAAAIADGAIDNATFAADVGSTAYATNIIALASDKALVQQKLDHLVAVAESSDVVNSSIVAKLASKSATPAFSSYDNTTDSLEANRDNIGTTGAAMTIAAVTGAVGSVAGNVGGSIVGSLTGNVNGNVVGTVGSVVGSVGSIAAGGITASSIATDAIDADALAADAVDEILDEVIEGTTTLRQALRLALSVLTGKSSGGGTATLVFRDIGDTKNRLSVTVDANGNRTAVGTRDGT